LLGGWLGEHAGLRASLAVAGCGALALALTAWRLEVIRNVRELPTTASDDEWVGVEADVQGRVGAT
jgi:hypothetical protein